MSAAKTKCSPPVLLQNFYRISEAERVAGRLTACGIPCAEKPADDGPEPQTVLVLLGESAPWPEVTDFLRQCADRDRRAVCLGLYNQPLEHHKIWELLAAGADEFLAWNQTEQPEQALLARLERWAEVGSVLQSARVREQLIGQCPAWRRLLRQVIEAACYSESPVLVLGDSGTGKELIARLIHDLDRRPDKRDFVVADCTTVVPELSGSEFFGHEKGAFTNAVANRDGAFALADGGTLFLDEIGELPLPLQAELLRVVQEKTYKRVGSSFWRQSRFRLVAATHRDLQAEVSKGRFREDLFYRISACVCHVPPLCSRRDDIPALVQFFLKKHLSVEKPPALDEAMRCYLLTREYRGNVRELQQLIARIAYRHTGSGPITVGDLPEGDRPDTARMLNPWASPELENALRLAVTNGMGLKEIKRQLSNRAMDLCIADEGGNLQAAAQRLQVSDRTLQMYAAAKESGAGAMEGGDEG
jgi:transcriptional regulator with GAF, ATPase, and Fis domain